MKNILLYTDTPQTGGAELQMFLLAKFLNKKLFTPILACSNFPQLDKWCENFEKEGIKVIRLNVRHKHDPRHYTQIKKIIKQEKIDLLHIHLWNPASCRYAFLAGQSAKIPIITTEHDPFKLSAIKNFFKKRALKKVSKIIAISENNKKILSSLYKNQKNEASAKGQDARRQENFDHSVRTCTRGSKFSDNEADGHFAETSIEVILNGIDTVWWQSQLLRVTKEDILKIKKEIFHAKEDTLIIATIAELHERKGLKYLIKAIPDIIKKYPNIKLIIIGDGPDRENLEHLIKKLKITPNIELLGKRKEIPKLLKSSNIFCLPSIREGFGLVNLEAMTIPLPIVATTVGGIPEVVKNNKTGILVPIENSEAITKALIELISSEKKRKSLAEEGFKRVHEYFDAKIMAKKYEKIYSEILYLANP